ncbi:unnamed protein product [Callosobruchus maculatus]|uniref:Uncharacterized protein n=1 Tax=Callosobruchus maculatus TaxID=64391 RepID=A0A653DBE8_CALMS|nr:unnamed protein product [Callosobruchus maculatus]
MGLPAAFWSSQNDIPLPGGAVYRPADSGQPAVDSSCLVVS